MYDVFALKSGGTTLAAYEWQAQETSHVVCLIHGIGEYAGAYDKVAEIFKLAGISTVAIDLRGHGCSPGKRGHLDKRLYTRDDVDNLIAYAKEKYGDIPLVLYGHSLGGNIVMDYKNNGGNPSAYIVTSPWLKLVRPISKPLYIFVKQISKIKPSLTLRQGISGDMLGSREEIEKISNKALKHERISVLTAIEGIDIANEIMRGECASDTPMLLMHGTDDPICDIEGSRTFVRNYRGKLDYKEWEGYLHELHNGVNGSTGLEVVTYVKDWIRDL